MISASTAFMQKVNNGDVPLMRMQLISQNRQPIWIEDGQFWGSGISFSEATSQDGAFSVGDAVIGGFSFSLTNFDRSLDSIDFEGAVVIPLIYYPDIEDADDRYIPKGIFYITNHTTSGNIIRCTAMDGLKLLDQSSTPITYPITVQNLIQAICTANSLTLATQSIPHGSFVLNEPPKDSSGNSTVVTDRQMLSYACQCIGCFAKMNELGYLEVKWYDFDNPVSISSTFDGKSLWTAPIAVTGLNIEVGNGVGAIMAMSIDANGNVTYVRSSQVSDTFWIDEDENLIAQADSGTTYVINTSGQLVRTGEEITVPADDNNESVNVLYGTDDRVIKISGNPYITLANLVTVCENISNAIFGKFFRPGTLPVLGNPCLQAGDVLQVTDRNTGLVYLMPVTSTSYDKSLTQNVNCAFEQKEDADLRPSASYNMRVSVANAMAQAQAADELAQAAKDLAETSGYQPYIISDKGTAFTTDTTATLTAVIYDMDMNEVDPQGTDVIYRWWVAKDGIRASYLDGGKWLTVYVSDTLCDYAAGIYFETKDISEGINPFLLAKRNDTVILTNRAGVPLAVRAAEVYG